MLLRADPGLIVWTAITFLILLWALKKLAWKPILGALESREERIRSALDEAEKNRQEAEKKLAEYEKMIEQARRESQEIVNKGRKTAEMLKEEVVQKANEEAARMLEKAKREISLERERAVDEIRKLAVDLSVSAASKLIAKNLTDADHKKIAEKYIQEMKLS